MARTGRPKAALALSYDEREQLLRWSRRAKSAQFLALRSRIVLACAQGLDNKQVAAKLGVVPATVSKWRRRFVDKRLDGLLDEPRPGGPRSITDEQIEQVVVATLERTPKDATHWSRASMAAETGLSRSTVGRIWRAFSLKPHLTDTFKLSSDPLFIEKVRDVVGLYLDPPERALVLCVDELGRAGAHHCSEEQHVSPTRPPNPACASPRTGLSTCLARWSASDGCRCRGPRGANTMTAVAVTGHRDAGRAGEHHPVVGDSPAPVTEPAAELLPADAVVLATHPGHDPPPGLRIEVPEQVFRYRLPEVVRPSPQRPVETLQDLVQVHVQG